MGSSSSAEAEVKTTRHLHLRDSHYVLRSNESRDSEMKSRETVTLRLPISEQKNKETEGRGERRGEDLVVMFD
jgi:hypothetical protein